MVNELVEVSEVLSKSYEMAEKLLEQTLYVVDENELVIYQTQVRRIEVDKRRILLHCEPGVFHFDAEENSARPFRRRKLFFDYGAARDCLVQRLDERKKSLQEAVY